MEWKLSLSEHHKKQQQFELVKLWENWLRSNCVCQRLGDQIEDGKLESIVEEDQEGKEEIL